MLKRSDLSSERFCFASHPSGRRDRRRQRSVLYAMINGPRHPVRRLVSDFRLRSLLTGWPNAGVPFLACARLTSRYPSCSRFGVTSTDLLEALFRKAGALPSVSQLDALREATCAYVDAAK